MDYLILIFAQNSKELRTHQKCLRLECDLGLGWDCDWDETGMGLGCDYAVIGMGLALPICPPTCPPHCHPKLEGQDRIKLFEKLFMFYGLGSGQCALQGPRGFGLIHWVRGVRRGSYPVQCSFKRFME